MDRQGITRLSLLTAATMAALHAQAAPEEGDSLMRRGAVDMPQVVVEAPLSRGASAERLAPVAHTMLGGVEAERLRVTDIKEMSAWVPNLHIPDYGARMTSTVYVRGLGSRIDQPSMGVYVDGIPLMNKNTYDFELQDISHLTMLRGPQNILYGRNAMGGVMDIKTLSPLDFEGVRASLEAGNGQTGRARLSLYQRTSAETGFSVAAYAGRSSGFYTNHFNQASCDWSRTAGATMKMEGRTADNRLHWTSTTAVDWVNQGGFPYQQIEEEDGRLLPIAYDDRCAYNRLSLRQGVAIEAQAGKMRLASATSYTYMGDDMHMDQDFTATPIFTLRQRQQDHTLCQDLTLSPWLQEEGKRWKPLTGVMLWWRRLHTQAPVLFRRTGIEQLILEPANKGIQMMCPQDTMYMEAAELPIGSNFTQQSYGAALFHNSSVELGGGWTLAAGGRVEYEGQPFSYDSRAQMTYHIASPDGDVDRDHTATLYGHTRADYLQWAPTASVTYRHGTLTWHSTLSRGYKAGGFNTQLFSELVRKQLTDEVLSNYLDADDNKASVRHTTRYKPEYSWNAETGLRTENALGRAAITLFYTDCRQQQLTVFPEGLQTGRMMANAGHSRIWGVEVEAARRIADNLRLNAAYGFTHATFLDYPDGLQNHRGKRIPYVPAHTLAAGADWFIALPRHPGWLVTLHADMRGAGRIWWDEENSLSQSFYVLPNASARLSHQGWTLTLWGRNLANTRYSTFCFESVGNRFAQRGKPLQWGATLAMTL